jgi:Tol biopolymer transport system component
MEGGSSALNTEALEGCPIQSHDNRTLYFASNRPRGLGGIDIWAAHRNAAGAWGDPVNLGAPVNSTADDFCPTPLVGNRLFFVSSRGGEGACGGPDIYMTRWSGQGWATPENLGCDVNSAGAEFSPSVVNIGGVPHLYFSSNRPGGFTSAGADNDHDIYVSRNVIDEGEAAWTTAEVVPGVNSAADDARPNVRFDGKEIVFDSTRPGGLGGPDIWSASRDSTSGGWSTPENLGSNVNSPSGESRASLSRDGKTLFFGSNRTGSEGNSDIYFSTREKE